MIEDISLRKGSLTLLLFSETTVSALLFVFTSSSSDDSSYSASDSSSYSTSSSSSRVVDGSIARGGPATEVPSAPRTGDKSTRSVATARATSATDARDGGGRREDVERRGGRVDDARGR